MMLAASISPASGWFIVITLGVVWVLLGLYWGRKAKTSEQFMLAGRNVGLSLGSATAMATWVTSNTMMVAPVLALEKGVWGMLAYATASFGLLLFAPMAKRIKAVLPHGYTKRRFLSPALWPIGMGGVSYHHVSLLHHLVGHHGHRRR